MDGVIQAGSRHTVLCLLREPRRRRTWVEFRYVIVSLPVAIVGFVFTVVTLRARHRELRHPGRGRHYSRCPRSAPGGLAAVSRGLAGRLLGMRVAPPPPFRPQPGLVGLD